MDVFLVATHHVELLIADHDMGSDNVRRVPERLTKAVETDFGVGKIGDALSVDGVVAVDALDDRILHNLLPPKLSIQRVQRRRKVGLLTVRAGDNGITSGDNRGAEIQSVADEEVLAAFNLSVGCHVIVSRRIDLLDVQLCVGGIIHADRAAVCPDVVCAEQGFKLGGIIEVENLR